MINLAAPRLFARLSHRLVNNHPRLRSFLLRSIFPNREVDIELFGSRLRVNIREEVGYFNAYKVAQGSMVFRDESGALVTLALLLEPTDTFVDVGANVGLFSSVLVRAKHVFPHVEFYAFEPNPDAVKRLRETLRHRKVHIFDRALSNQEGDREFSEGVGSCSFGVTHASNRFQIRSRTQRIRTCTLDSLDISGESIVLKIDVEFHEREVIDGATRLLASGRVKAVYLDGYSDKSLPHLLQQMDFKLFDGRTLEPGIPEYSLLALHHKHLERWAHADTADCPQGIQNRKDQ